MVEIPKFEEFEKEPEFYIDCYTLVVLSGILILKDDEMICQVDFTKTNYMNVCKKLKKLLKLRREG